MSDTQRIHVLKTWRKPYAALVDGRKPFEFRRNDRDFRVGDRLVLKEWDEEAGRFTGAYVERDVTYIAEGPAWGIPVADDGTPYAVLGLAEPIGPDLAAIRRVHALALRLLRGRPEAGPAVVDAVKSAHRQVRTEVLRDHAAEVARSGFYSYPDDDGADRRPFVVMREGDRFSVITPRHHALRIFERDSDRPILVYPGQELAASRPFRWEVVEFAPPDVGGNLRPRCPDCGTAAGLPCPGVPGGHECKFSPRA